MKTNNKRMNELEKNGIDTSKYFTLLVNETIPAGSKINILIDSKENDEIEKEIIENGYVKNTKLHRRFVMAQYMRMLNYKNGWHGYLKDFYGYMYQFDMMENEIKVLKILEKEDIKCFEERKRFFTIKTVNKILDDYAIALEKYIMGMETKHNKHGNYIYVKKHGNIYTEDINAKIFAPIDSLRALCKRSKTYSELYENFVTLNKIIIELPWETKKSKTWIDTFQKEGAFYTLKNMIMFHEISLFYNGNFEGMYDGLETINNLVDEYAGYQMNALLKKTIEMNNFNFNSVLSDWVKNRKWNW